MHLISKLCKQTRGAIDRGACRHGFRAGDDVGPSTGACNGWSCLGKIHVWVGLPRWITASLLLVPYSTRLPSRLRTQALRRCPVAVSPACLWDLGLRKAANAGLSPLAAELDDAQRFSPAKSRR